ncbi:MAG: hypothetical protein II861_04065, partial [Methanomicrobium sp.]|nr:hypothetical protein [Methanomicrobium sp.]
KDFHVRYAKNSERSFNGADIFWGTIIRDNSKMGNVCVFRDSFSNLLIEELYNILEIFLKMIPM